MRLSALFMIALTFAAAAVLSLVAASFSVQLIEDTSEIGVRDAPDAQGQTLAAGPADGRAATRGGVAAPQTAGAGGVRPPRGGGGGTPPALPVGIGCRPHSGRGFTKSTPPQGGRSGR